MQHDTGDDPLVPTERHAGRQGSPLDPLAAFPTEAEVAASVVWKTRRRLWIGVGAVAAVVVVAGGLFVPSVRDKVGGLFASRNEPATGILVIETTPPGWEVVQDGRSLGSTPFRASLPVGRHALVLRSGGESRPLTVDLQAGAQVFHNIDLQAVASTGVLGVTTTPPGAVVEVDGIRRGLSPIDVTGLAPGEHSVTVTAGNRTATERATVIAGRRTALLVPVGRAEPPPGTVGFVTVAAPIELQVYDGDALVGSSRNQRVMVVPGRRRLRLANPALGFERVVEVNVVAGAVSNVAVPVPNGSLSVNAVPWAEVTLDGKVIGETPIANFAVLPGSHEIVLRNPKFPEQRRTIVVTLTAPLRVGVDLRQ